MITTFPVLKLNRMRLTFFPFNGYKYQILYQIAALISNNIKTKAMKFTKSERALHQPNYNPPCNVYQPQHVLSTNKILTGSLAAPAFISNNTFGYQTRFQKQKDNAPGPGSYIPLSKAQRKDQNINTQNSIMRGKQYPIFGTVPSIPYSYYGQHVDEEENNYIQQLLLNQNISKASDQIKKKQPAFSFSKSEKNLSYIPKKEDNSLDPHTKYNYQLQVQEGDSKKKNIVWHEKIKRVNERRLSIIQSIDPQFVPSLQLIEMIKKKTNKPMPGPGEYQNSKAVDTGYQIFQNMKGFSFTSSRRFSTDKTGLMGPGVYHPKNINTTQKFSFAKQPRNVFQMKDSTNFRFYIDPNKEVQKIGTQRERASSCPFGSNSSRFTKPNDKQINFVPLDEQNKKKQNEKLESVIKSKLRVKNNKNSNGQKDEGLLRISTMASTIQ